MCFFQASTKTKICQLDVTLECKTKGTYHWQGLPWIQPPVLTITSCTTNLKAPASELIYSWWVKYVTATVDAMTCVIILTKFALSIKILKYYCFNNNDKDKINVAKCNLGKVNIEPLCYSRVAFWGISGYLPALAWSAQDPLATFKAPVPKLIYWRWV